MVNEMSLRLEKLVEDIKEETIVWPIEDAKNSIEEEAAWARIGAKHKMTGSHVKSIFKVLSKKYEVEKANPNTEWKLFSYLSFLDIKKEEHYDNDADFDAEDNEEFVELLEVNDEYYSDDDEPNTSGGSLSESSYKNNLIKEQQTPQIPPEIQIRKLRNDKKSNTEKKDSKNGTIKKCGQNSSPENCAKATSAVLSQLKNNEQSVKKSAINSPIVVRIPMAISKNANVCIPENKTQSILTPGLKLAVKRDEKVKQTISNLKEVKLKRKFENNKSIDKEEDDVPIKKQIFLPKGIRVLPASSKTTSKPAVTSSVVLQQPAATIENSNSNFMPISPTNKLPPFSSLLKKSPTAISKEQGNNLSQEIKTIQHIKQEREYDNNNDMSKSEKSKLISNSIINNNKVNGIDAVRKDFSEKGEGSLEIEQISKDADENTEIKVKVLTEQAEKILPTFFRDLYNSKKYDSFGMYVSSTMNRLPLHLASKLEAKILQSIIEVNAMVDDDMEDI